MGDGATTRPHKTHIIYGATSLRVIQNFDAGCRMDPAASPEQEQPKPCESHDYFEEYRQSAWIVRVSRRFGNGPTQQSVRATQVLPSGEDELWQKATFKIGLVRNISAWSLHYLGEALRSGGWVDGTITTAVGVAHVTPHCADRKTLAGLTLFYSTHNLQLDYTDHPDIAAFASRLCTTTPKQ